MTDIGQRRRRRISLVASTAALVLLGGGIGSAAAAQQAMPGDALYGMKRSIENVSTNVSVGDDSRGRRELEHAMTRLAEVRALAEEGADVETINRTLEDFSAQARRGVSRLVASYQQDEDPASITAVTTFITAARQKIADLAGVLPVESSKAHVEALTTINQLAELASGTCPGCEKPKPVKGKGPATVNSPDSDPSTEPGAAVTTEPSSTLTVLPPLQTTEQPTTQALEPSASTVPESNDPRTPGLPSVQLTSPKPTDPGSDPSNPSQPNPTLPTPSLPTWPWPYPTLTIPSLPLPCLPLLTPCR